MNQVEENKTAKCIYNNEYNSIIHSKNNKFQELKTIFRLVRFVFVSIIEKNRICFVSYRTLKFTFEKFMENVVVSVVSQA